MSKRKQVECSTSESEVSKKLKTKQTLEKGIEPIWQDFELLSQETAIEPNVAQSLIKLFEDGNTIPFIARYRKQMIGYLGPAELRIAKEHYEDICSLKSKLKTVSNTIEKSGHLTDSVRKSLCAVRTIEELEHVYAPFKPESKRSLSERAKAVGLEKPALNILQGICEEYLESYIQSSKEGLKTIDEVEKGVIHIIASIIATDTEVLEHVRELRTKHYFFIETKQSSNKKETKASSSKKDGNNKIIDESKYSLYFDFKINSKSIKPHQVLAINRGESQKVLSVKINVPDFIFNTFSAFCVKKFLKSSYKNQRSRIINEAVKDCYTRLIQPLLIREIRSTLKEMAAKASMEVFSKNLKQLLLASPVKGKLILGIDPGFSNGCKLALISETGMLVTHNVIYPFKSFKGSRYEAVSILQDVLLKHKCELIAVGNGTACRETESWLSELISTDTFSPLKVTYTIVNEDGASIYSCGTNAKKEFPKLDPNIISAVSLARRVQDPLAELVKVEPQHLGVGMYQHDLKKKLLSEALNEVVSECVSFVGADINTASQCLLKSIAGLTEKRADLIIQYREENGPFTYRKELLKIKGIGEKIFLQCAGFIRVGPINLNEEANFYDLPDTSKLDRTIIHPESYNVARKLLKRLKLDEIDIGNDDFIEKLKSLSVTLNLDELSSKLNCDLESLKLILDALKKPLNHDLRTEHNITPLFKKGLQSMDDLKIGTVLSGRVTNVTSFGCFVDIGVHINGLIHVSNSRGVELQIGDRVEVEVLNIEIARKRIGLKYIKMTN